ncbi:MAG TPA: amino acid aminotransferase [Acidimicrobiia bacterium]|nr:amino acid aminotransferase [Acidimicrobiia bacterium]
MFERVAPAPPDPILGLIERFRDDPSPDKVDLGVGVYRDESGRTPVIGAVREAARIEAESLSSKAYFGQAGNPALNPILANLVLGDNHPSPAAQRGLTLQTPGGSGALRVAAELVRAANAEARVWIPTPTWANHRPLIGASGLELVEYPYYDMATASVDRGSMFESLASVRRGDVILVHATCHNPTGADLTPEDFRTLAALAIDAGTPVLVDNAYQGFAEGLVDDSHGTRTLVEAGVEVLVCTSFSKNFGLYRDRAGALTIAGPSSQTVRAAYSRTLALVRTMYSVPPDHGPALVARVLTTPGLRGRWEVELEHMRTRLNALRASLVQALDAVGVSYDFIARQRGMFSLLGISPDEATRLVEDHHIYLPSNGRINVAGLGETNVDFVAGAIAAVTASR